MLTRLAGLWPLLCAALAVTFGAWLIAAALDWQTPIAELAAGAYVTLGVFAVWLGRWQARRAR